MKYMVVWSYSIFEFESLVEKALKEGWTLQGGVSVTMSPTDSSANVYRELFAQALIK